jgi:PhnB protein
MAIINPSINFNGNCEEAFHFYQTAFGGEFTKIIRFKDMPSDPEHSIPDAEANKIMHITLAIGHNVLMGNDVPSFMGTVNENEHRSKISIQAASKEEAEKIYATLSA